jgi:hypothetical protein
VPQRLDRIGITFRDELGARQVEPETLGVVGIEAFINRLGAILHRWSLLHPGLAKDLLLATEKFVQRGTPLELC